MIFDDAPDKLRPIDLGRSLIDTVYDRLVDAIATDQLSPGSRLNQRDLAERLMVSRQPVSHALHRLRVSGLAVESGRKGLVVAPVDPRRLRDLYDLRTEIEALAAARATENMRQGLCRPEDVEHLARVMQVGDTFTQDTPVLECIAADVDFHLNIYRLCGSDVLTETIEPLWPHFRRSMGNALSIPGHREISWRGHHAIVDAIFSGDAAAARAAARDHISIAGEVAIASLLSKDADHDAPAAGRAAAD